MKKIALVFSLSLACAVGWAHQPPSFKQDDFISLQAQYFSMLDFRADRVHTEKIPFFAASLSGLADDVKVKWRAGDLKEAEQSQAGLVLIYDSLMTINNMVGVSSGALSLSDLARARRFGNSGGSPQDELTSRANYAVAGLELATQLRPSDRRIDSWLAAARTNLYKTVHGGPSETTLKAALDAISARPTFNLWTAILLFHDQSADTPLFATLASEARKFVDATQNGGDPCRTHPEDCNSGTLAPYNLQAAVTVLADVFARRSEVLFHSGNISEAMEMLGYAKGTYAHLETPAQKSATESWPDKAVLPSRLEYIGHLNPSSRPEIGSFAQLSNYNQAYECSSCHGRSSTAQGWMRFSPWHSSIDGFAGNRLLPAGFPPAIPANKTIAVERVDVKFFEVPVVRTAGAIWLLVRR